ncbi:MAG: phosphoribosylamine--glycine ligase [Bacteroidales bacterium]
MKVLLLGSGGREHAIAWKLAQSRKLTSLFIAPGNAGTLTCGTNISLNPEDFHAVRKSVLELSIDVVIVGPEGPLVAGIHDFFLGDPELCKVPVIGPVRAGALLEGSKDFAKAFMEKYEIPTAAYKSFDKSTFQDAITFMNSLQPPYVLKADGLAAGKGVVILDSIEEATRELESMFNGKFGDAGNKVVIEQFLDGIEMSAFVITDGKSYKILPGAKDYKRVGDGDTGLNTGGMGAVSPVPFADVAFMYKVEKRIIKPTIEGLQKEGIDYKGFIFFGLMNVDGDPFVIEYNVRLGDPETEVIMPRIKSDFLDLVEGVARGDLGKRKIKTDDRCVTTVMLVSGGYPGEYEKGKEIHGLANVADAVVFHAGTKASDGKVLTNGGRVLSVSAWGNSIYEAREVAYRNVSAISWDGMYYRADIGQDLL